MSHAVHATHRPAAPGDANRLLELRRKSILALAPATMTRAETEAWAAALGLAGMERKLRELEIWVAEAGGAIVGWGAVRGDKLEGLYTDPDHAGRGIGTALLSLFETLMRERGIAAVCADASANAEGFYCRRGYEPVGTRTAEGAQPMRKRLQDRAATSAVTLSSGRIRLRRWRREDRDEFAAMNCDARVMEFFRSRLTRAESDAMADGIARHFADRGFGLWAIEAPGVAPFIGFAGLAVPRFNAHFTPCVEIGWRLAFAHWGHGFATEAARLALGYGFGTLAFAEVVSFTSVTNHRSRAVMERLGMRRDPADDFDHPSLPDGHALRRHVLYRLRSDSYFGALTSGSSSTHPHIRA